MRGAPVSVGGDCVCVRWAAPRAALVLSEMKLRASQPSHARISGDFVARVGGRALISATELRRAGEGVHLGVAPARHEVAFHMDRVSHVEVVEG
jgi:hypothetical protein